MRAVVAVLLLLLVGLGILADPRPTRADDDLGERVNQALDRACEELIKRQAENGAWRDDDKHHPLGRTALAIYALLHAGYVPDDPPIKKGLARLGVSRGYASNVKVISTYEAGCLLLMLNALGRGYEKDIQRLCKWLVKQSCASHLFQFLGRKSHFYCNPSAQSCHTN